LSLKHRRVGSLRLHVGDRLVGWVTEVFPVWSLERDKASVSFVDHSHSSFLIFGDDPQSLVVDDTVGSSAHGVSLGRTVIDIGIEEVLGIVRFQPLGKETELSLIGSSLGQGDLVSPPTTFNGVTGRVDWSGPTLGSSHDNHGPPGLGDGFTGSCGGLDLLDLFQSPLHGCGHVVVDVDVVLIVGTTLGQCSVLDNSDLVTVTGEQAGKLQVVHGTSDGPFSDLVSVGVQDGDNGTTLCGVDVLSISLSLRVPRLMTHLVGVPSSSSRSSLTLTITNDGNSDHIRLVHNTSVGYCETVSKFSTFVDSSGGLTSADSHLERGVQLTSAFTWEGNPPGILNAWTKASIPSFDIEYSG